MINLENVHATQHEGAESIIGYLTWFSVPDQVVTLEKLQDLFDECDLDKEHLPTKILVHHAFRRATQIKDKRKTEHAGVHENYITREVACNLDGIIRHIVCETVDTKGKRLKYEEDAAILILERKSEIVKYYGMNAYAKALAKQAAIEFELYKKTVSVQTLRSIVQSLLQTMAPTPVRPSGGVYFVPKKFEEQINNMNRFLSVLDKGEGRAIPLINDEENRDMIRGKLLDHIGGTMDLCNKSLSGELKDHQVREVLDNAKRVLRDYTNYTSIISKDVTTMEDMIDQIRKSVITITEKF
ncbi:DUF6744 family protein [Paenibacillus agricola]|uniref:Uncharacterized protein n=1 Tax=Paenibacillus agricola TaxID=2716264 RepID=A0ABX0JGZ9_9BACL|nr:DUF6744 family protein [Paenibacillus agricola]NHN34818.1 hypothetical protein [Paenibacillus agricola]